MSLVTGPTLERLALHTANVATRNLGSTEKSSPPMALSEGATLWFKVGGGENK